MTIMNLRGEITGRGCCGIGLARTKTISRSLPETSSSSRTGMGLSGGMALLMVTKGSPLFFHPQNPIFFLFFFYRILSVNCFLTLSTEYTVSLLSSCLLSPVSCLLSPVSCLLSPVWSFLIGRLGWFPANYVEYLDENGEVEEPETPLRKSN